MFDRKVHHFDESGRVRAVTPFTEIVRQGFPNCLIRNRRAYTADGATYPKNYLSPEIIEAYGLTEYMDGAPEDGKAVMSDAAQDPVEPNEGFQDVEDADLDAALETRPRKRGKKKGAPEDGVEQ